MGDEEPYVLIIKYPRQTSIKELRHVVEAMDKMVEGTNMKAIAIPMDYEGELRRGMPPSKGVDPDGDWVCGDCARWTDGGCPTDDTARATNLGKLCYKSKMEGE